MTLTEKYVAILKVISNYYGFSSYDFINLLKEKENKYILLLLLKKYNCFNEEQIKSILNLKNKRSLIYNVKKAEEKLLVNRDFREKYFEIEEGLLKYY